jgi:hypothetical protein
MEHLKAGYAGGLNGNSVPFYDNFYAGGSSSVRGSLPIRLVQKQPTIAVTGLKAATALPAGKLFGCGGRKCHGGCEQRIYYSDAVY